MQSINHRYDQLIDEYMFSEIEFENDDIVIDCGANIGEIYNALKRNNSNEYSFSYYAFEPSKYEFSILNQNSKNLVDAINYTIFAACNYCRADIFRAHLNSASGTISGN